MDDSRYSREALEYAFHQHPDADVTVLHVVGHAEAIGVEWTTAQAKQWKENVREQARELLADAEEIAADHGRELTTTLDEGATARTITDYADDQPIDHIIMGSRGRTGLKRILLGSVAESVIRQSPVPVTVIR